MLSTGQTGNGDVLQGGGNRGLQAAAWPAALTTPQVLVTSGLKCSSSSNLWSALKRPENTMALDPEPLRALVQDALAKHLHATAVFYADKLVSLSDYAPGDVYLLAQVRSGASRRRRRRQTARAALCRTRQWRPALPALPAAPQAYYVSKQHRRAVMLLKQHGLADDVRFRYLSAKCLAAVADWDGCLGLLGDGELDGELAGDEVRGGCVDIRAAGASALLAVTGETGLHEQTLRACPPPKAMQQQQQHARCRL